MIKRYGQASKLLAKQNIPNFINHGWSLQISLVSGSLNTSNNTKHFHWIQKNSVAWPGFFFLLLRNISIGRLFTIELNILWSCHRIEPFTCTCTCQLNWDSQQGRVRTTSILVRAFLNFRSSNTLETVLVSISWYLEVQRNMTSPICLCTITRGIIVRWNRHRTINFYLMCSLLFITKNVFT